MDIPSVAVCHQGFPGDAGANGGDSVAIEVDAWFFARLGIGRLGQRVAHGDFCQGVPGFVRNGGDQEFALLRQVQIVFGMIGQGEGGAGGCAADGAFCPVLLQAGIDGLTLVGQHTFAMGAVLPRVLPRVVPGYGPGDGSTVNGADRALRTGGHPVITNLIFLRMRNCLYIYSLPAIPASLFVFPLTP